MSAPAPDTLVINFNAPELNQLAAHLARRGRLSCLVRPYVNKGRLWERLLARTPGLAPMYESTFGRRRLAEPALPPLTREAGVMSDLCQAVTGRSPLPGPMRHRIAQRMHMQVRAAVAAAGAKAATDTRRIVAYEGFALPAFAAADRQGEVLKVLSYPVAHHRHRRRVRDEEVAREPAFALTWPGFDDWAPDHEERLDAEIARADGILVGSDYVADTFVTEGVDRTRIGVVPYGVDLRVFTPGQSARGDGGPFKVIFSGQLTQRKGLSYLLRAYQRFRRADSELVLVGAPVGDTAPLRRYADLFTHVPHQTRPALAQRYRDASVFVLPTLIEGMPLVVVEAMACALPVIVTANGPAGIVRDGIDGFIVPERDEDAICDRLDRLYRDPALRREMGRRAAERARAFSWDAFATAAERFVDDLAIRKAGT